MNIKTFKLKQKTRRNRDINMLAKIRKNLSALSTGLALVLSSVSSQAQLPNAEGIANPGDEWLNYGRDYSEQRYSTLTQINDETVGDLGLDWSFTFPTKRVMESTPLVHKGRMYVTTSWSRVYAFDARKGTLLWEFNPEVPKEHLINSCCGPANRGAALWHQDGQTRLFVGSFDGRLIALDTDSGEQLWSTRTVPANSHYTITGAPRVIDGKVIIGNGGAELGVRGYVSAYDVSNGELLWRFYTVPGNPEHPQENEALNTALKTWAGEWWTVGGGGGTVWDAMAYDPELDLLYIGTGNGSPWNRDIRSPGGGDNLYLSSIVALRPSTGEYVWHYQVTPKDSWDYTATQHLILADIDIQGESRPVIMQAPKNGFFYVLDRRTGELLSADAYAQVNWASHIDLETGRPVETKWADYNKTGGSLIWPAPFGAHNWQPMSFSQQTGLVYIPVQHVPGYYQADKKFSFKKHRWNTGTDFWGMRSHPDPVISKASADAIIRGYLTAWDPVAKAKVWEVEHFEPGNGGILSTQGNVVFQGTGKGAFNAYRADNGDSLWSFQSDSAILSGPMTYQIDGEQYVAVTQGSGGALILAAGRPRPKNPDNPNRLLVFKLNGKAVIEGLADTYPERELTALAVSDKPIDHELIDQGDRLYEQNCAVCHGVTTEGSDVVPDLRLMSEQTRNEFMGIVLGGSKRHTGMVGFYETLDYKQVEAIQAFVEHRTRLLHEDQDQSWWDKIRYWFWYFMAALGDAYPDLANESRNSMMGE